jgi:hypothetical protein
MIIIVKNINNCILFNKKFYIKIISIINSLLHNCFPMKKRIIADIENNEKNENNENNSDYVNIKKIENREINYTKIIKNKSFVSLTGEYEKIIKKDNIGIMELKNGEIGYTVDYNQYVYFIYK